MLARSLSPAHACRFRAYASCPGVRTSDHAPVHLSCELDFPSERECRNSEFSSERRDEKEGDVESLARVTLALRIRVYSFRVALEDDEESYLDDRSSPRDADDDANVVVQSSPGRKETAMEALVARAARLRTTHSADDRGTDRGTVPGEHSAVTKTSHHGLSDASAGARAAMEKLTRGAAATARFFLQTTRRGCDFSTDGCRDAASEGDETRASGASVGAGVTCRPVQPHIERDEQTDASSLPLRDGFESDKSLRVSVPAVVAHWAASSLPAFERAGLCDDASLERSVRALGARVVAASVAVDKEHAGIAVIPLGDVCDALRGEKLETLRAALAALSRGAAERLRRSRASRDRSTCRSTGSHGAEAERRARSLWKSWWSADATERDVRYDPARERRFAYLLFFIARVFKKYADDARQYATLRDARDRRVRVAHRITRRAHTHRTRDRARLNAKRLHAKRLLRHLRRRHHAAADATANARASGSPAFSSSSFSVLSFTFAARFSRFASFSFTGYFTGAWS